MIEALFEVKESFDAFCRNPNYKYILLSLASQVGFGKKLAYLLFNTYPTYSQLQSGNNGLEFLEASCNSPDFLNMLADEDLLVYNQNIYHIQKI